MGDRLKEKVALVSGAGSSGPGWDNGKATAVLFAREGAKIFAADINFDAALETKRIIEAEGGFCKAVSGNVSRAGDVAAIVDACIAAFGRIDVLYNNVGIVEVGGPVETSEESWDRINNVNLKSMFLTCKHVLPHMERQGKGSDRQHRCGLGHPLAWALRRRPRSSSSRAVEQCARFGGIEHRRLPGRHDVGGLRTEAAGLTGTTWPVTSQSNR